MHYRAHPRHYRSEYVRGYLHRQAMCTAKGLLVATIPHEISIEPGWVCRKQDVVSRGNNLDGINIIIYALPFLSYRSFS